MRCCSCGVAVRGAALEYGARLGSYRCAGTHCKRADSELMRALRGLGAERARGLEGRVELLERTLRQHGIEPPV